MDMVYIMSNEYDSVKQAIAALQMQNEMVDKEKAQKEYLNSPEGKLAIQTEEKRKAAEDMVIKEAVLDALIVGRGEDVKNPIEDDSYSNKGVDFLHSYQLVQGGKVDLKDFSEQWKETVQCIAEEDRNSTVWDRRDLNDVAKDCLNKFK